MKRSLNLALPFVSILLCYQPTANAASFPLGLATGQASGTCTTANGYVQDPVDSTQKVLTAGCLMGVPGGGAAGVSARARYDGTTALVTVESTAIVLFEGFGSAFAQGSAAVDYQVQANQIQLPPVPGVTDIPLIVSASLWGTHDAGSGYAASLNIFNYLTADLLATAEASSELSIPDSVSFVAGINPAISEPLLVLLAVNCAAEAFKDQSSNCTATADPVFQFDQATFDSMMGTNTFPLDQYYALEFSPNVLIPIPPAFYLFGSGLVGLIGIAKRKKRPN